MKQFSGKFANRNPKGYYMVNKEYKEIDTRTKKEELNINIQRLIN